MKPLIISLLLCPILLIFGLDFDRLNTLQTVGVFTALLAFVGLVALLYKNSNLFKIKHYENRRSNQGDR